MKKTVGKVNPPQESDTSDKEKKQEQLEKDKMTSEGGLPETPKPKIPSKLYFEHKYKEITPRQFLTRILMREDMYERFHWY